MIDYGSVPPERQAEYDQLLKLLMDHAAIDDDKTRRRAAWVARAALEPVHLYVAMGFDDRSQVRALLRESFPELEAQNDRDMRWKKFFYRRMCGWAGFTA